MPFDICQTCFVFPDVHIYDIVENILYQFGVRDNLLIKFNFHSSENILDL